MNLKSGSGVRIANARYDQLVCLQRNAPPVFGDVTKQPVFNLGLLTRPRGIVTNLANHAGFVS